MGRKDPAKLVENLKWLLFWLDVLIFFISLSNFGICLWVRFDLDLMDWFPSMEWYKYWNINYLIMLAVFIAILNTLWHLYALVHERMTLFRYTAMVSTLVILMQITGFILILIYGIEESSILTDELRSIFMDAVYRIDEADGAAMSLLYDIQESVGCCGAVSSQDYRNAKKPLPYQCRDSITGQEFQFGCAQQFAWFIEPWSGALAGCCITLVVMQLVQLMVTIKLFNRLLPLYEFPMDGDWLAK